MAKDGRQLRDEAAAATAAGKHKRALAAYLELERLEPRDAQWAKRAGETYRRLGNDKLAIEAFARAADRYAQSGFLVQAIAVCKLILQLDPQHATTLGRLARMNEQVGQGPTRAQGFADNNPALHANPHVAAIRGAGTGAHATLPVAPPPSPPAPAPRPRAASSTSPPALELAVPRTKSKPIELSPGAALDSVHLAREVPDAYAHSSPGIHVIPIDEDELAADPLLTIEVDPPDAGTGATASDEPAELELADDELTELALADDELADVEAIPLAEPRAIGSRAQRALAATPLFAGLPQPALEALVEHLTLVHLEPAETLFHEGDVGDALYVIVEGEVAVHAEGPPRVEMARLGAGAFLGEVALMTDQPRSATVTAATRAELLRIDRHTLSRVLANHGDVLRAVLRFARDRLVDRWMRTSPLFRPLSEDQGRDLAGRFQLLEVEGATKLLGAGARPAGLYIVLAGNYLVQRDGATIATLGPGDLIGEAALLSGEVFRSDVVSRGKSLALCLPAAEFREVIMTHPYVLEYMSRQAEHSRRLQIL